MAAIKDGKLQGRDRAAFKPPSLATNPPLNSLLTSPHVFLRTRLQKMVAADKEAAAAATK